MADDTPTSPPAGQDLELREWLESLEWVLQHEGSERAEYLLWQLRNFAQQRGAVGAAPVPSGYVNSIPVHKQPVFPGSREIERRIKSIVRWNAMAMVVRANQQDSLGGHISTYASAATLFEIGFNHFFRAKTDTYGGDLVLFQGHASPGVYARAFLEGRLTAEQLTNFRRELAPGGGLSSYPHPWLMPGFWQVPTVSMGLGPLMGIYQARFMRYLEDRGLKPKSGGRVWVFMGDGETDEPESLGSISLAAREGLDNLVFVINCNLQRLDGPVRGNGKIIQELDGVFRGAGWNVIKVVWGSDWDALLERDHSGLLMRRMAEAVDGEYQKYSVSTGAYIRQHFFGKYPELLDLVSHLSDEQLQRLGRGGHDPAKVYAAYHAAVSANGAPTVILAKTIKGYGLGEAGEGKNITHQQKKLNEAELLAFRTRFGIPISDAEVGQLPFFRPPPDSPELRYLHERRKALGGYLPTRAVRAPPLAAPPEELFQEFYEGTSDRTVSTTMVCVRILAKLLKDKALGRLVVPIVPDEARTFGLEALFRQYGIYSHAGQKYDPVDSDQLLYYKEATNGQILEEGITEAGSMSSFIAAGTAYATHGINTIPFFTYYSMFGFQRIGDLIWAAGDMRTKGFLLGCTAGRTTLNGEGLQHQDGHSHLLAGTVPNCLSYDPAFAFEIAVLVQEGIRRMYHAQEDVFYYLTLQNEEYAMPPMPDGAREGILRGLYKFRASPRNGKGKLKAHLFGSGSIMNCVLAAATLLEEQYGVAADVWSVTSYNELRRDGLDAERWNLLHPGAPPRVPYVGQCLARESGVFVASSDYVKALPDGIRQWVPGRYEVLGTDGFGRSDTRAALRDFFEIDERYIAMAALSALHADGRLSATVLKQAAQDLHLNPDKANPRLS